jgi:hypothetical protein
MGAKEDESSTGCIQVAGFHHVVLTWMAFLKLQTAYLFNFPFFFGLQ